MPNDETVCYHCGQTVFGDADITVHIADADRAMCCHGCAAVAQAIIDSGHQDYYRYRTAHAQTAPSIVPDFLAKLAVYDLPEVQKQFVSQRDAQTREAFLILEGIVCAACVWVSEQVIRALPGVESVQVNFTTRRAQVVWDVARIQLSDIIKAFSRIGYQAHPYDPDKWQALLEKERKQQLKRLSLAGLFGMQVMMIAVAIYAADFDGGMQDKYRQFFHWVSLGLTLPILLYCAAPFFQSAWRDLSNQRLGMDAPVSLGIGAAFLASVWTTITTHGHIYYDSIAMFVFFLSTGRYFELAARKHVAEATESLAVELPTVATRLTDNGAQETVTLPELALGDRVLASPGQVIPVDGKILQGRTRVDESLLTGESRPLEKNEDSLVVGGSINIQSPIVVLVEKTGVDTALSQIQRLLQRAQADKPAITQIADKAAQWFVAGVILIACCVGYYWWSAEHPDWLSITLSVLIVTCPCALSLATPTAITAATGTLVRNGLLTTRACALETLAKVTHVVFDKTGTVTTGRLRIQQVVTHANQDAEFCLRLAAGLEARSEHPISTAFRAVTGACAVQAWVNAPGYGMHGVYQGAIVAIGGYDFVRRQVACEQAKPALAAEHTVVYLGWRRRLLCAFVLTDELRAGAPELIARLQQTRRVYLLSGDQEPAVQRVAKQLDITTYASRMQAQDKVATVQALQQQGAVVAMLGDGVNDAPVLSVADVSIAMGGGTPLAQTSADMVLLSERLDAFGFGVEVAVKTVRIIRQNILWAIGYNMLALPLAAMGWIAPWMAAIGMSVSSLLVVLNALRLSKLKKGA